MQLIVLHKLHTQDGCSQHMHPIEPLFGYCSSVAWNKMGFLCILYIFSVLGDGGAVGMSGTSQLSNQAAQN